MIVNQIVLIDAQGEVEQWGYVAGAIWMDGNKYHLLVVKEDGAYRVIGRDLTEYKEKDRHIIAFDCLSCAVAHAFSLANDKPDRVYRCIDHGKRSFE